MIRPEKPKILHSDNAVNLEGILEYICEVKEYMDHLEKENILLKSRGQSTDNDITWARLVLRDPSTGVLVPHWKHSNTLEQ